MPSRTARCRRPSCCVAIQRYFFAFARAHPRPGDRHLLPSKHHITWLTPPTHTTGRRIRSVRWTYSPRDFLFQNRADNLQPCLPSQPLNFSLQFFPHLRHRQRHLHQQLPVSHYLKLLLVLASCSLLGIPHGGSPFRNESSPAELYRSSGESRCSPFQVSTTRGATSDPSHDRDTRACPLADSLGMHASGTLLAPPYPWQP